MRYYKMSGMLSLLIATILLVSGCAGDKPVVEKTPAESKSTSASAKNHSGWWCIEHAIPEEVCSMCSASYAKECKEKGDWCEKHNRAESQCFICDPTRAEKYVKLYEAKYGKKPPAAIE
jgi:hypothetical protein